MIYQTTNIPSYYLYTAIPFLICLLAQFLIKSSYHKYSQIRTRNGVTGAEAARRMLDAHGLSHIQIECINGELSDHYDPSKKVLRLSQGVYNNPTVSAVGVACHEAGHACQHAENFIPLAIRNAIIPIVNIGSNIGMWIFMIGLFMSMLNLAKIGLIAFSLTTFFTLITLPVEFNASKRAETWLNHSGMISGEEGEGVKKVLSTAALTYVAAAIQSIGTVLYYASMLSDRDRSKRK